MKKNDKKIIGPLIPILNPVPSPKSRLKAPEPILAPLLGLRMPKKKVFVSFDYDNDRIYKFLLQAWSANPQFDFVFADETPSEINSINIGRIKAAITTKIKVATHTLVIVGQEANKLHMHHKLIGFKNWINFEVHQSKIAGNKIVAVKLDRTYVSPDELLRAGASWAMSFTQASIIRALLEA